uniref:MFS domain-containing protein n=1 Tax=Rhabditophanes sp. KR3021 TaxID=114890 RepID=A0AC35U0J5_9BILA
MYIKCLLTEVLEASHLTDTYSNLTAKNIIKQLKSGHDGFSVRYENIEGDNGVNMSSDSYQIETKDASKHQDFTVDEAIEILGFGRFQIKLSLLTGLAWMADSAEMMILSILSPALHCEWGITPVEQAMITTCVFVGMMLSSTIWGKICDTYGRKKGLMAAALVTFSMGALSSLAPDFHTLLLLRLCTGLGIGGVSQGIVLYAEFLPTAHRARCVILIESFWAVGALFEVVLALFLMEAYGWRWLLFISSIPLLIFTIFCFWLPESPRYSMAAGKKDEALETLQRVAFENSKPMLTGNLVSTVSNNPEHRGNVSNLFTPTLKKTTLLLWFIWMVNAFSYYGIVLFTTVLFQSNDECHGFESTNVTDTGCKPLAQNDYMDLLSTTFAEFPGLIITCVIIEYFGRKKTMAIEFGIFSLFTFLLYFCMSRNFVTFFIFVARAFISGAFQCVYVYTPEVYATSLRAVGLGAASSNARIGAIITPFLAVVAGGHNIYIPIAVYGLGGLLGAIAALNLPIETQGRLMTDNH